MTVAALYVQKGGVYYEPGLDVDCWDEERDARKYAGPYPVVAHPPCARFCRLAGLVEKRWGYKRGGDDGGCFEHAKWAVETFGGVLEHPAFSDAFAIYGIPRPLGVGWQMVGPGRWVAYVEQGRYGHVAKKAAWLYACGIDDPPRLNLRRMRDNESTALVSWCGNHIKSGELRPRVGKARAAATPIQFRDEVLLAIARRVIAVRNRTRCSHPNGFVQLHNPNTYACLSCGALRMQLALPGVS